MSTSPSQALTTHKKVGPNKLIIGFLVAAVTAIIASTGVAGAQSQEGNGYGYGGDTVNVGLQINQGGNNNTVVIIFNYFFGN